MDFARGAGAGCKKEKLQRSNAALRRGCIRPLDALFKMKSEGFEEVEGYASLRVLLQAVPERV